MARRKHFDAGHQRIDPLNPYITDKSTEWSDIHKAYITTVYGLNTKGERIMKYQVREKPAGQSDAD